MYSAAAGPALVLLLVDCPIQCNQNTVHDGSGRELHKLLNHAKSVRVTTGTA